MFGGFVGGSLKSCDFELDRRESVEMLWILGNVSLENIIIIGHQMPTVTGD